jgi:probable rRNA maturation factor
VNVHVDIQTASAEPVPDEDDIRHWIATTLAGRTALEQVEVSVRLVDAGEMAELNRKYRGKSGPTNVLSFPATSPEDLELPLLGDIVICAPVVRSEAASQGKNPDAHWAHMAVHGTLHLLGYDHIQEQEAASMEAMETAILAQLDYANPYESPAAHGHIQQ